MSNWVSIGAMWVNEDGKYGLAFSDDHVNKQLKVSDLNGIVKVFSNDYKKEAKHPDYRLFIHQDELAKLGIVQNTEPSQSSGMSSETPPPQSPPEDDSIPF